MKSISLQIRIGGTHGKKIYDLNRQLDKEYDIGDAHITLYDFRLRNNFGPLADKLELLLRDIRPFSMSIEGVGTWDGRWIYLKVRSGELSRLNRVLHNEFSGKTSSYLKPKSWVPHITISFSRSKFKENLKALKMEKISFATKVDTLYLIKKHARGDYWVLKRFKLQAN